MLITEEYKKLNAELHETNELYGTSGHKYAPVVADLVKKLHTKDVLDYGCGKCTLKKSLAGVCGVKTYDPALPEHMDLPSPADIVVCTDVMEHIEPDCLDAVLTHIKDLTKKIAFISVATRPARKTLADGRNAHLIVQEGDWWFAKMSEFFVVKSYNHQEGEIWFICQKR